VDLIGKDDAANAIIEMLARLGRRLSMVVVAEGVESAGQTTQLKALGVHEAQGYFIARPMPGPQAQQFVGRWLRGRAA